MFTPASPRVLARAIGAWLSLSMGLAWAGGATGQAAAGSKAASRWRAVGRRVAVLALVCAAVNAAPPLEARVSADGEVAITSGDANTPVRPDLLVPSLFENARNSCPGSTETSGYRWNAFIADPAADLDAAVVVGGVALQAPGGDIRPLVSVSGLTGVGLTTDRWGGLSAPPALDLATGVVTRNGNYHVGYFCSKGDQEVLHRFEVLTISNFVSPTSFSWTVCACRPPSATADGGDGQISGFVLGGSVFDPIDSYRIQAVRIAGAPDPNSPHSITVTEPGPYSVTGLVNGSRYAVRASTVLAAGVSAPTEFPDVAVSLVRIPPPNVTPRVEVGGFRLDFGVVRPADSVVTSYTISAIPELPAGPITVPGDTTTWFVPADSANSGYLFDVQANFLPPYATTAGRGLPLLCSFACGIGVIQEPIVIRPVGALVLTQRCGVSGAADAYVDPTFGALPVLPASPGADVVGGSPGGSAPTLGPGGPPDPRFGEYPYPVDGTGVADASYPTHCSLDLGTARLVTSGPRAGQYFAAVGRLAQISVVDTRDSNSGWTVNGRMSDLVSDQDTTDRFSGNLLGWNPKVSWHSGPDLDGYQMTVTAGDVRQPTSTSSVAGLGHASNSTNTLLSGSLAQALPDAGLGIAAVDARLRLLIPVTADAGTYRGTLTLTVV